MQESQRIKVSCRFISYRNLPKAPQSGVIVFLPDIGLLLVLTMLVVGDGAMRRSASFQDLPSYTRTVSWESSVRPIHRKTRSTTSGELWRGANSTTCVSSPKNLAFLDLCVSVERPYQEQGGLLISHSSADFLWNLLIWFNLIAQMHISGIWYIAWTTRSDYVLDNLWLQL